MMSEREVTNVLEAANLFARREDGADWHSLDEVPIPKLERLLLVLRIQREIYNIERRDGLERACMLWEFALANIEVSKRMNEQPIVTKRGVAQYGQHIEKTYSSISKARGAEMERGDKKIDE